VRDPLSWVPVKYKLPLSFICICVVAFGLGGFVVNATAREALTSQILRRLDGRSEATRVTIEQHLDLIGRRAEDFASDGFIRSEWSRILATATDATVPNGDADPLRRHLTKNKLPIVASFVDAALLDRSGTAARFVHARWDPPPESLDGESTWFGPLRAADDTHPYPTFLLSTPLTDLSGEKWIGSLQLLVRADTWAKGLDRLARAGAAKEADEGFSSVLIDPAGRRLVLEGTRATDAASDRIRYRAAIPRNGWTIEMGVDRAAAMAPIAGLRARYLLIGGILLAVTFCVLFFPVRFLLRPLGRIGDAARRIAAGDFSARVHEESKDEMGDLARAFNIMAGAVEERTRRLQETAAVLERREGDIRFERDRLDAVIRAMRDGLFILSPDGSVWVAARPRYTTNTSA